MSVLQTHEVGISCRLLISKQHLLQCDSFMALIYSYPKAPGSHLPSVSMAREKKYFPLFTSSDFMLAGPHSIITCPEMDAAKESEQF